MTFSLRVSRIQISAIVLSRHWVTAALFCIQRQQHEIYEKAHGI